MMIFKIWGVWLKNWGSGSHLYFEVKMDATRSILKLQNKKFLWIFALAWTIFGLFQKTQYRVHILQPGMSKLPVFVHAWAEDANAISRFFK